MNSLNSIRIYKRMAGLLAAAWVGMLILPLSAMAVKPWQVLEGCHLVESHNNDGDSFRVSWGGGEMTLRIYFADTPEVNMGYWDRIQAQAEYFGITPEQVVKVGEMAREFTQKVLNDGFDVQTRWQGVFGGANAARQYGIVMVDGEDLADLLVANGLARIHGTGIGGQTWEKVERLRELEAESKAAGLGAWGIRADDDDEG